MYSPTRQPAKRCREPVAFAAADRGDRARRVRGDRHGEAAVIPYDAAGASARACGSVEGSTLGAAEVRRLHHSRTPPDSAVSDLTLLQDGILRNRMGAGSGAPWARSRLDEIDEEDEDDEEDDEDYSNLDEDSGEEREWETGQGSEDHD